ncbi:MAG: type III pantothenate kinase [Gammaproteobacteria bacterium]|nr:type III pantothenate kinase [Gammaproteobacteria bacterium]
MTILELDLGNTRCKWRILQLQEVLAQGVFPTRSLQSIALPKAWHTADVDRVRIGNVAGEQIAAVLTARLQQELELVAEFAVVQPCCAGVECGYELPRRLGVDRWLAVLAAYQRDPSPALVVDCGSAITLDVLGPAGCHQGGYVLPGLSLMRRALYRETDAVIVRELFAENMPLTPGHNTEDAVNRGLPLMVLGLIERARDNLIDQLGIGAEPVLWLAGGDGQLLASLCPWSHRLEPDLVLDGLALTNP